MTTRTTTVPDGQPIRQVRLSPHESFQAEGIRKWKEEQPSTVSALFGAFTKPVVWLSGRVVPVRVMNALVEGANSLGSHLADEKDILRAGKVSSIEGLRKKSLRLCDRLADSVRVRALAAASVEGAATGAAGLPGLLADIPFLITFSFRTIHKTGLCYGYRCGGEEDRDFVLGVLSAAGANTVSEKYSALLALRSVRVMIARQTLAAMAEKAAMRSVSKEAAIVGANNLARQLGINLTRRKVLQVIPAIGAVVGGCLNGWFLKDVCQAARRAYQERWLIDNGKIEEV